MAAVVCMADNPFPLSAARQPRGIVQVNGVRVDGWIRFEADNNVYSEADTFRVTFALSALPLAYNDVFWSTSNEIFIEIFAGFPVDPESYTAGELKSLVYGRVDEVEYDPVARQLNVSGRDLTAVLIDARTTETYQNVTSSQVVATIANRRGFTPVITMTKGYSGKYLQTDTVKMNTQRSEWDILTTLAAAEKFVVFVKGRELHFQPLPPAGTNIYPLKWEAPNEQNGAFAFNGKTIHFRRALNIAKGIVVEVIFTMPNKKGNFKVRYPNKATGISVGQSTASSQLYQRTEVGITRDKALQIAQQKHTEITRHEVKINASLPADNVLAVTSLISVTGTGTAFDQTYYPESIVREMDINSGYMMTVTAKNHSPATVIAS